MLAVESSADVAADAEPLAIADALVASEAIAANRPAIADNHAPHEGAARMTGFHVRPRA